MPIAGIEPTSPRPQRGVLTTILNRPRINAYLQKIADSSPVKIVEVLQFLRIYRLLVVLGGALQTKPKHVF
uniref:RNA polymerase sigma factor n=1 Tax=Strongyloides venezuelensis TaxID=75913 RepID=A0A0K0G5Z4_STRVS